MGFFATFFAGRVSIPHGGLRTMTKSDFHIKHKQVSIPHGGLRTFLRRVRWFLFCPSPSHTVGLERDNAVHGGIEMKVSPSHTVGLEQP